MHYLPQHFINLDQCMLVLPQADREEDFDVGHEFQSRPQQQVGGIKYGSRGKSAAPKGCPFIHCTSMYVANIGLLKEEKRFHNTLSI